MSENFTKIMFPTWLKQGLLLVVLLTLYAQPMLAQAPDFMWAQKAQGTVGDNFNPDMSRSVAVDGFGNSYITGYFKGSMTFGTITLTSSGMNDIFIAKYNAAGIIQWAQKAGGAGEDKGYGIAVDNAGNSYITGDFSGTANFNTLPVISRGDKDIFIAKYNTSGTVQWAQRAGGINEDTGFGIAVDGAGNPYITGLFNGTSDSPANFGNIELTGSYAFFTAMYHTSGTALWAEKATGFNSCGNSIAVDNAGNAYVTGFISGGGAGFGSFILNSAGVKDICVVKYNSNGSVQWAQRAGGSSEDIGYGIAVDNSGNAYVTGAFMLTANFGTVPTLISYGDRDIFIAKYNTLGTVQWAKQAGASFHDRANAIAVDGAGNATITGHVQGSAQTFGSLTLTGANGFVAGYNTSGVAQWVRAQNTSNYGIDMNDSGNIYLTGYFLNFAYFGDIRLEGTSKTSIFITKMGSNTNSAPTDIVLSSSSIDDNALAGTAVGTFSAADPDADETHTFELVTGTGDMDNAAFNLTADGSLSILSSPDSEAKPSYEIRVRATDNGGLFFEKMFTITVYNSSGPKLWTGAVSNTWSDVGNWAGEVVPGTEDDVVIAAGTTYNPILNNGTYSLTNLTLNSGATLILAAGNTLQVSQIFENNGNFIDEGGTLITGGIAGASTTEIQNFTVPSTGAELQGNVAIGNILILQGDLNTNNKTLMLLSDESGTAYVNNDGGEVLGEATMERYIDGEFNIGPGYRHFSSPVANTTLQDMVTENYTPVVNPAYNTAANPYAVQPFPNVFGYDQSRISSLNATTSAFDYGWYSPASLSTVLDPGKGYSVNIPSTAKVALSGTLNNGDITVTGIGNSGVGNASGWHLLGNPYPSPIDWTLLNRPAGIDNAIYVYRSSGQYAGTYAAFINGIGDADARYIAPMQGFFVHANTNSQSFTFNNAARVYDQNPVLYRTTEQRPQLQLKLIGKGGLADEAFVYFQEGATTSVNGQFDAYKVLTYNTDRPTLFARLGQDALSIKGLPLDNAPHSLPLEFYVTESGNFTFSVAKLVNFPAVAQVKLLDRTTGLSHDLSQGKEITLALTPSTDPHRFVLNFSAVAGSPLSIGEFANSGVEALVYPNPSNGDVNLVLSGIEASAHKVELTLYNALGQLVLRRQVIATEAQAGVKLETATFAKGIYHLHIQAAGKAITRKLVLSK